jgi:hypothetical protein
MASLKKKAKEEAKVAQTEAQVEETKKEAEEKHLTKAESEAIIAQQEAEKEAGASTLKLERATALISGKFNLGDDFKVTNFNDKGKVLKLTLENKDFVLSVDIKDADRHGLILD